MSVAVPLRVTSRDRMKSEVTKDVPQTDSMAKEVKNF